MYVRGHSDPPLVRLVDRREEGRAGDLGGDRGQQPGIRVQEIRGAGREVQDGSSGEMLRQPEDDGQLVVASGSGNRMHGSGHTLIPVISLSGSCGEGPILKEKGLVPRKSVLEEVGLPSLILSSQTILVKDSVELPLGLRGDVIVQVLVSVGDVLSEINLAGMDPTGEHLFPIVSQHTTLVIRFQNGKEEHVLNVGGGHYSSTLAHWSGGSDPDLLLHLSTGDGFCLMGAEGVPRIATHWHVDGGRGTL